MNGEGAEGGKYRKACLLRTVTELTKMSSPHHEHPSPQLFCVPQNTRLVAGHCSPSCNLAASATVTHLPFGWGTKQARPGIPKEHYQSPISHREPFPKWQARWDAPT